MRARDDIIIRKQQAAIVNYQSLPAVAVPRQAPEAEEPSLLRAIGRHFWIVIVCALLGAAGAWIYITNTRPLFSSESKIYLELSSPRGFSEALGSQYRSNYLFTQAELIRSTPILKLATDTPAVAELRTFELTSGDAVRYMREELKAEVGRKDDIISVWIRSPYPDDSAKIVNAVVEAYVTYLSTEKKTNTSSLLDTLKRNKAEAEQGLDVLRARMYEFQKENPALNFDEIYRQEMGALSAQYTQAQLGTIEAKATFGPGHPTLQKSQQREQDLYAKYQEKLQQFIKLNMKLADYSRFGSELAQKEEFNARLDERIRELQVNKDLEQIFTNVQVLEPAIAATNPSHPRPKRTLAVSILVGLLLGAGLALLRDRVDGRMRSVEEIQTVVGLPILGVVPGMNGRRTAVARAMIVHLDPRSVVAEAYRTVRTALYFSTEASHSKTILVTSPDPGDGKTTSASNLAIAIAQTGRSVLLLDADFRKPTQHKNLDVKDSIGLSSVLAGREPLDRAIQRTGVEGLDILPCGPIPANPSEILNSREFGELVDTLAARYDHILFDSPPVNAVTDARILGAVCDVAILVLRADKSTRKSGEHARAALSAVGANLLGAIVNDAPKRRGYESYGGSYGYGGQAYGYGHGHSEQGNGRRRGKSENGQQRLPKTVADVVD